MQPLWEFPSPRAQPRPSLPFQFLPLGRGIHSVCCRPVGWRRSQFSAPASSSRPHLPPLPAWGYLVPRRRTRPRGRGLPKQPRPPPPPDSSARGCSAATRTAVGKGPAASASPWAPAGAARRSGSRCWGPGWGLRRGPLGEAGRRRRLPCPRPPRGSGGCTGAAGWCCCSSRCWASRRAWSGTPGAPSRTRRARPTASPAGTSRCSCCGDPSASCPASRSCGSWTREVFG